jgi:hypothetical protein
MTPTISLAGRRTAGFGLSDPMCPALPSGSSAVALLGGDWNALPGVVGYTILRGALIGAGMLAAGERKHVVRNAVAGTLAIEAFVIGWAAWKLRTLKLGAST